MLKLFDSSVSLVNDKYITFLCILDIHKDTGKIEKDVVSGYTAQMTSFRFNVESPPRITTWDSGRMNAVMRAVNERSGVSNMSVSKVSFSISIYIHNKQNIPTYSYQTQYLHHSNDTSQSVHHVA